ncbi:MAG: type IX secretion system protein PorQ [Bacteroidaceae bacterium]|nr:type IX secretion system protein PorQ [Bacteroidaceae bacterium]
MSKFSVFLVFFSSLVLGIRAQQSTATMEVLSLPSSPRAAALGGENVSVVDDNAGLALHNPALLYNVSPRTLSFDFMSYASGATMMGAQYVHAFGERHSFTGLARYLSSGSMDETAADGTVIGSFTPKDIMFGAGYSYLLNDYWTGGANLKFVYSHLADFSAFSMAVDVGLNYYNPDKDLSFGIVAKNVGAQIANYNDCTERVPFSLQTGISKAIGHSPVHVNVTAVDLTKWNHRQYYTTNEDGTVKWTTNVLNHFVVGLDYKAPSDLFWLSLGYNFRRAYELKAAGSTAFAGITAGGGIHVKGFSLGLSYARYHRAASSIMVSAAYSF